MTVRRELYDGLVLGAVVVVLLALGDTLYLPSAHADATNSFVAVALLSSFGILFTVVGFRARRRTAARHVGGRAGALAGFVVGGTFIATIAIAGNPSNASAAVFVVPVTTMIAALLGELGASFVPDE